MAPVVPNVRFKSGELVSSVERYHDKDECEMEVCEMCHASAPPAHVHQLHLLDHGGTESNQTCGTTGATAAASTGCATSTGRH